MFAVCSTVHFKAVLKMNVHYTKNLNKSARAKVFHRIDFEESPQTKFSFPGNIMSGCQHCCKCFCLLWNTLVGRLGDDWIFLTLLGIIMALLSFAMDVIIERCHIARIWMFEMLSSSVFLQYLAWILFPLVLVCFATGFTHLVGPNAIGSGIPEIKTIMRGVALKEYLTFNTLVAKVIGLSTALGSGLPIGKEGPFVHVASISASLLAKLFSSFRMDLENASRNTEVLAAACAVGVACTFAAPIGGVLFSIEVTANYFAVRNYWRGFYSAICGAIMFRLMAIWFHDESTLTALFKTNLRQDVPFDPMEIVSFAIVGVVCGIGGALLICSHKYIFMFMGRQKRFTAFLQRNRLIYPSFVTFLVMSLLFPPGLGQFMAGMLTNTDAVNEMFGNTTWSTREADTYEEDRMLKQWRGPWDNIFITLTVFIVMRFWMCVISTTLPVPSGIFIPSFTLGAACGRLIGESLAVWFPSGIGGDQVVPGGYAIVGAAAFSGSVTHTVSTAVIVFELTGQIGHVLPCVIAVFIANVLSKCISVSFYDMIVEMKNLPYLHSTVHSADNVHQVFAKDFMSTDINFLTSSITFREIVQILDTHHYRTFPVVDNKDNMVLLGSIRRTELERAIADQFSLENKRIYFRHIKRQSQDIPSTDFVELLSEDEEWNEYELNQVVNIDDCRMDPAPFQFVEKTSLYKVHSLFSRLSLHHAFVTRVGRLVGIISLDEVRRAIQKEINITAKERFRKISRVNSYRRTNISDGTNDG